jgi:hypothetical protein
MSLASQKCLKRATALRSQCPATFGEIPRNFKGLVLIGNNGVQLLLGQPGSPYSRPSLAAGEETAANSGLSPTGEIAKGRCLDSQIFRIRDTPAGNLLRSSLAGRDGSLIRLRTPN